ncbi:hypothetical protein JTE90_022255 [Oedothorax gibbosus]|uniref:Uncharacterized protein n=1 Tax=Oedothorax gibbosus TaxID=931172 RepID=A0AAV6VWZ9_9ARAC|nr:hypothetical protein JTE90_022255 [Oedothorax gibbosus]
MHPIFFTNFLFIMVSLQSLFPIRRPALRIKDIYANKLLEDAVAAYGQDAHCCILGCVGARRDWEREM